MAIDKPAAQRAIFQRNIGHDSAKVSHNFIPHMQKMKKSRVIVREISSYLRRTRSGMGAYAGAARRRVHLATVLFGPPSGHRPGRRQARQAHILQIGLHLTQPWSLWTPLRHGPAPRISSSKHSRFFCLKTFAVRKRLFFSFFSKTWRKLADFQILQRVVFILGAAFLKDLGRGPFRNWHADNRTIGDKWNFPFHFRRFSYLKRKFLHLHLIFILKTKVSFFLFIFILTTYIFTCSFSYSLQRIFSFFWLFSYSYQVSFSIFLLIFILITTPFRRLRRFLVSGTSIFLQKSRRTRPQTDLSIITPVAWCSCIL